MRRRRIQAFASTACACVVSAVAACGIELVSDPDAIVPNQAVQDAALADLSCLVGDGDVDETRGGGDGQAVVDEDANTDTSTDANKAITCPLGFAIQNTKCIDRARNNFKATANPSGNWTWASRAPTPASAPITTYPVSFVPAGQGGIQVWSQSAGDLEPSVFFNPNATVVHPYGTFTMEPSELAFHPGPQNERSVVRWTAPVARTFSATVLLRGLSGWGGAPPTTTGVTVMKGAATVMGPTQVPTDAGTLKVDVALSPWTQGETLDVILDYGSNGNYGYDSTGIDAIVSAP